MPIYRLISEASDVPRPRVLRTGSLADCLDELKEAVLVDVVRANAGRLTVVEIYDGSEAPVAVVISTVTGYGY